MKQPAPTTSGRRSRVNLYGKILLAAILVLVVATFFFTLDRDIRDLSPREMITRLETSNEALPLGRWQLEISDCGEKNSQTEWVEGNTACAQLLSLKNVTFPLDATVLNKLPQNTKGRLHARIIHQLTKKERTWLHEHRYATILIPRNVQNKTRLLLGEFELTSLGNGANSDFLFESPDLLKRQRVELVFDYTDFSRFGPLDVPIAIVTPDSAALYESLPTRQLAGTSLLRQASLLFRLSIAAMAVVLDHSLPFAALSVFAALRTVRGLFSMITVDQNLFGLLVPLFAFVSALTASAFVMFVLELCRMRPRDWRWVASTIAIITILAVGASFFDPKAWLRVDLILDVLAGFAATGAIGWSLWVQLRTKREESETHWWFNSQEHSQIILITKLIILVALSLQISFDISELSRVANGQMKDAFDWRQTLFFPLITLAGLLEVGYTSRKVEDAAKEMTKKAVQDRELAVAREYQMRTIPELRKRDGNWRWRALYHPASNLGGDWFDVRELRFPSGETALVACVADITGHGLEAALSTTIIASAWGLWCGKIGNLPLPTELVEREALIAQAPAHLHLALTAARRTATGTGFFVLLVGESAHFCSAGHPNALVWDGTALGSLLSTGPGLGIQSEEQSPNWSGSTQTIAKEAKVVLFSDGIFPLEEGASRGVQTMRRTIKQKKGAITIERILGERFLATRRIYRGDSSQEDDMTLLILRQGA
jgi:serine phosphatase RsbU (regulator of sigma subunit)